MELVRYVGAQDESCSPEVRSLGRTLLRWVHQIAAWHASQVSNGPTEAANNLIKRVKRAAFGFTNFRNYRIRALLYAGNPTARDGHSRVAEGNRTPRLSQNRT